MRPVGILGLQGDFEAHRRALEEIGAPTVTVLRPRELGAVGGLIIPGGESTTLVKLIRDEGFVGPLSELHSSGRPILGTCAGAILLASRVVAPPQFSLGFIDITIERNAYGRQGESFETTQGRVDPAAFPQDGPGHLELVLIRAPRIISRAEGVDVLVRLGEQPVLVRQGVVLAATFHPELGSDRRVQKLLVEMARAAEVPA